MSPIVNSPSEIKTSKQGIDHLHTILSDKPKTISRASLWGIHHKSSGAGEVSLKLARYKKILDEFGILEEQLESKTPKSELTLTNEEFHNLITFLQENYEPFKQGIKKYIPLDEKFDQRNIEHVKAIFANPDTEDVLSFIVNNKLITRDLFLGLQHLSKVRAVERYIKMLELDLAESVWQKWFEKNSWVLGTEFVRILDERQIDTANISDFLMEAYDGFIDIVEIKRPGGGLKFWADQKDHDNYYPHSDLTKAITQASKYIYEVEQEANSVKFLEKVGNIKTIKPRCVLIYGRSSEWNNEQKKAYRILNANYHNLTIMTYDHILARANRLIK